VLEDFQNITTFNATPELIIKNLAISLICGVIISLVYRWTYKGPSYSAQFTNSLILLGMITTIVIMVIGNNLATAFGLVGAMSIIRFRTAVRDVQDIVFIFYALSIGLAAGVGFGELAIIGTIFISIVVIIILKTNFNRPKRRSYLLQLKYTLDLDEAALESLLKRHCRDIKLVNLQTQDATDTIEAYYNVALKNPKANNDLISALKNELSVGRVNLYFDEIEAPV
jgi:uncharacterized membrane protein YhiD involved in acid resistance